METAPLYLETVSIEGFKSFSEKTDMGFEPGIGVIIGNNGVGKSNILDAIVWTLGEDDLNRLRCRSRSELFFSGSKNYPPASRISVILTFKKGKGEKAPVVKLGREMTAEGQNSFRVGDQVLDRGSFQKQLVHLGFTHSLRSIIRQEQINDMLMLDPRRRFQWIGDLLNVDGKKGLAVRLENEVRPLFHRYLDILIPDGEGKLQVSEGNGQKGVEVEVTLPGNRNRKAHQLSGGEKAVTSLALKLALFAQFETPFYLLDEVEPSLDYTNHKSMQALLKQVASTRQLIMITHLRSTVELANTVHGVRTRWDGSSFMKFYFVMDERLLRLYKCC